MILAGLRNAVEGWWVDGMVEVSKMRVNCATEVSGSATPAPDNDTGPGLGASSFTGLIRDFTG